MSRVGPQARLNPAGTTMQTAAAIIVTPVIGRNGRVPPPHRLTEDTIAAQAKARPAPPALPSR